MEKYNYNVQEMDHRAVTLVVDLAKAFEKVQLKSGVGLDGALRLPSAHSASFLWVLSAPAQGAL